MKAFALLDDGRGRKAPYFLEYGCLTGVSSQIAHLEFPTLPFHFRVTDCRGIFTMNTNRKRPWPGNMAGVQFPEPDGRTNWFAAPCLRTGGSAICGSVLVGAARRKPVLPQPGMGMRDELPRVPAPFPDFLFRGEESEEAKRMDPF